jgi:GC-rich sequence DNA-binding factor
MLAQQESMYSQYMIQPFMNSSKQQPEMSTSALLEEAYAKTGFDHKPKAKKLQIYAPTNTAYHANKQPPTKDKPKDTKLKGPRMPQEIAAKLQEKLDKTKVLNAKHIEDIDRMITEVKLLRLESMDSEQKAPVAAAKYRFYQEIRCYVSDLSECLDEKFPKIAELEQRSIALMSKCNITLIERRRQDVRDQAKEMTDAISKFMIEHDLRFMNVF